MFVSTSHLFAGHCYNCPMMHCSWGEKKRSFFETIRIWKFQIQNWIQGQSERRRKREWLKEEKMLGFFVGLCAWVLSTHFFFCSMLFPSCSMKQKYGRLSHNLWIPLVETVIDWPRICRSMLFTVDWMSVTWTKMWMITVALQQCLYYGHSFLKYVSLHA